MSTSTRGALPGAVAAAFLVSGCGPGTELIVVVDTNLEVPAELDAVDVVVTGPGGVAVTSSADLAAADAPGLPLTLGVSPGGEALGPVTVAAIGRRGGGEVVRQSARVTLVRGERRTLHLLLLRSCEGRSCAAAESCGVGGCEPLDRPEAALPPFTGELPPFDTSDPCVAMPWDVDGDGSGATACGGTDCDDGDPSIGPAAPEECDGIDNDCDGRVDPPEVCDCAPVGLEEDCTTACGTTGRRTCRAPPMGWSPCAPPSEICNGIDDDCDGDADEGFAYVATPEVLLTSSDRDARDSDVVWAGDRFVVVFDDAPLIGGRRSRGLYLAAVDGAGAPIGAPDQATSEGMDPSLAWNGTVLGLAYYDTDTTTGACCDPPTCSNNTCTSTSHDVELVVLALDGTVQASRTVNGDASTDPRPEALWDGEAFAVSYFDADLVYERIGTDGTNVLGQTTISADQDDRAAFAWTGAAYASLWGRRDNLRFVSGDATGFPATSTIVFTSRNVDSPSLVWTGGAFVGAYASGGVTDAYELVAMDARGMALAPAVTLTSTGAAGGWRGEPSRPGLAAAAGQVLVVWEDTRAGDTELYFARTSPRGEMLQGETRLTVGAGPSERPSVAWSGRRFGVSFEDQRPGDANERVYFTTVGCP